MSVQYGGKTVYGANLGILMLETRFPRIIGDIGNALTWPFPVQYRVVRGATPDKVVRQGAAAMADLTGTFIDAARDLVVTGADGITTNCGFLSLVQEEVADAIGVPFASSSLMQVPGVQALLPRGKRVGILTISKASMTDAHLIAANVPLDTPVVGTEGGREFTRGILDDEASLDFAACRLDLIDASRTLVDAHENIGAIVLECTNMVPYAADVRKITGLPVYSIYSFVNWFQAGLMPRRFGVTLDDPVR
ncbi:MAG: aspartate/glutamate racemase family protein [Rhodobacterales bacterium]|nr:aspartate/glutamate racemase family protein [Rhodobacterales bacterium]